VHSSDIVVVGAGVIGCAVAYELARRGASVRVLDGRPPGMGATYASAGVLAPYIEARDGGPLLDLTERSLSLYDEFVAQLRSDTPLAFAYERSGTLDVTLSAEGVQRFCEAAAAITARGRQAELLDARATRAAEPHLTSGAAGGLLVPSHGFVAAPDLTMALADAARRRGAIFAEPTEVRSIAATGTGMTLESDRGTMTAGTVVMAAGSWAGRIAIENAPAVPVRPIRGQLVRLGWQGEPMPRVLWGERCYLVPWRDGTLLVGATVEDAGFDERTTIAGVRDLIDAACELVPHAWTATFIGARAGLRPGAPDHLPIVGVTEAAPNVIYATGHYRNGVLLAPLTAQVVADRLLSGVSDPSLTVTSPARFGVL
jgi:glycine oxidase